VGRARTCISLFAAVFVATLALASTAAAKDPGRWLLTGASSVPNGYWQGLTSDPTDSRLFFIGPFQGLWQTTPALVQTAGVDQAIPTALRKSVGYNHIGDPTWLGPSVAHPSMAGRADAPRTARPPGSLDGEGGRVVLPMECYNPSQNPSNTCGKGAFGIADPSTLAFRYYVQLAPKFIPKAMWAETSPNGKLIWTSSGNDLIAYHASQVSQANAAPSGPQLKPVKTLTNAVPPTGVTGAVFRHGQLLIAGESNHDYDVWAVNTKTGNRKLKLEQHFCGESEGLDLFSGLGGRLHWIIAPSDDSGCTLTFGPTSALLHFVKRPARERYEVNIVHLKQQIDSNAAQVEATVQVTRAGCCPVRGARVRFAGGRARTGAGGVAIVSTTVDTPGWFSAYARKAERFGISKRVGINVDAPASSGSRAKPGRG
jgi:hypothetical protein